MLYIVFNSVEELERFIYELKAKRTSECVEECEKACFEGEELYNLGWITVMLIEWRKLAKRYECNLSLVPCAAYEGCGDFKDEIIRKVICKHFSTLVAYLVDIVRRYNVMFAAITSAPYEPDKNVVMFSDDLFEEIKDETYVFYIRDLGRETVHRLYICSNFFTHFFIMLNNTLLRLDLLNPVINDFVPLHATLPVDFTVEKLRQRCRDTRLGISSKSDFLCILRYP